MYAFFLVTKTFEGMGKSEGGEKDPANAAKKIKVGGPLHQIRDGALIGMAFMADYNLGWATTLAVYFHELAYDVQGFITLKYSTCGMFCSKLTGGLATVAGAALGYGLGFYFLQEFLSLATGGFVFFGVYGVLTELKDIKNASEMIMSTLSLALGMYFMYMYSCFGINARI